MKLNKILTTLFLIPLGISLTISSFSYHKNNNINIDVAYSEEVITILDMASYLETKEAHYPISDEFIEKYQQLSGGYIDYAKKLNKTVDKTLHEPDQKWHFFTS